MQKEKEIRQITAAAKKFRWLVLAAGLCLVLAGVWRQEYSMVLARAIQICLGCIGIG